MMNIIFGIRHTSRCLSMKYAKSFGVRSTPPMLVDNPQFVSIATRGYTHQAKLRRIYGSEKISMTSSCDHRGKQFLEYSTASASGTDDEYGELSTDGHTYVHPTDFLLENGETLSKPQLRYMTYGELNKRRDNVIVVCHALTASASLHSWWGDMLGPGLAFDTDKYLPRYILSRGFPVAFQYMSQ